MRFSVVGAALAVAVVVSSCTSQNQAALDTDDQKASYALGLEVGTQFAPAESLLDPDAFMRGFRDALTDAEPALDPVEGQGLVQAFAERVRNAQTAEMEAQAETNRGEGEAYLEENGQREGVTTTESGLQYEVLDQGDGPRPAADDRVTIHYTGTLIDGSEFDSTSEGQPATFGVGQVIPGFSEGLQLMPVGSRFRLVIPSDLAYGPQGSPGGIEPNATLIFEIELLEIAAN
ncbi:MAG: FKBP-type peptidyl-prolyl cis-trans isomerase [Gemmatimonadales bacterium]|jgi:FKBP-type peptidyl-prolyl cis-trans isomerase|nr:MAG: FKBP-type peptidyl-prolyl cis-trans isomerase [Gemmatimonadales bacterium]